MKIAFRADASVQIGAGHVMRCLTLAAEMRRRGHTCIFICRDLHGHLGQKITDAGFEVALLPATNGPFQPKPDTPSHAAWAGVAWDDDAAQTRAAARDVDWLVVDHYAFDARWQDAARGDGAKVAVIDDLADRPHNGDLLLDQNLGRTVRDYDGLVPLSCTRLIGPHFALLRPEFAKLRNASLARRKAATLSHILISMGGIDKDNVTADVLDVLHRTALPHGCKITAVMGRGAPWLSDVETLARTMAHPTRVAIDVTDMASLMMDADLAIGAAGGTSWERACLALPSLHLILADNQTAAAEAMAKAGISVLIGDVRNADWTDRLFDILKFMKEPGAVSRLATGSLEMLDGQGSARFADALERSLKR